MSSKIDKMTTGCDSNTSMCMNTIDDNSAAQTHDSERRTDDGDDMTDHPAHIKLLEIVEEVIEHNRLADVLHIVPKKYHGCKEVILFEDCETSLVQECVSIDHLVSKLLTDYTIKRKHTSSDTAECAICTEELAGRQFTRRLPCGHIYHCKCLRKSLVLGTNFKCPLCRHDLLDDYIKDNLAPQINDIELGTAIAAHAFIANPSTSQSVLS